MTLGRHTDGMVSVKVCELRSALGDAISLIPTEIQSL